MILVIGLGKLTKYLTSSQFKACPSEDSNGLIDVMMMSNEFSLLKKSWLKIASVSFDVSSSNSKLKSFFSLSSYSDFLNNNSFFSLIWLNTWVEII
jgi:hypothetical protein